MPRTVQTVGHRARHAHRTPRTLAHDLTAPTVHHMSAIMGRSLHDVRRFHGSFDRARPHWADGNAVLTHLMNYLHVVLPAGERAFVKVTKDAVKYLDDEQLIARAHSFAAQEAAHAGAHARAYRTLGTHGISAPRSTARVENIFARLLGTQPAASRRQLRRRVAYMAAVEHVTGAVGEWAMCEARMIEEGCDQQMVAVLLWHAAEEVEHADVAFDILAALGGRWQRLLRMKAVTVTLLAVVGTWMLTSAELLNSDPESRNSLRWRHYREGVRRKLLPDVARIAASSWQFARRGYHPLTAISSEARTAARTHLAAPSPDFGNTHSPGSGAKA